ncbi:S26 family signal peptidase [Streptosporangium canum]|uniref:S26 family signal peptidase n=1 Tax=Streptosporangium canum TaxID=324952 RepID=UPI0036BB8C6A
MVLGGLLTAILALTAGGGIWIRRKLLITDVSGLSMLPAFDNGDRVLAIRTNRRSTFTSGQVVVLSHPHQEESHTSETSWIIKRVAAVAGEPTLDDMPEKIVPEGYVMVLGDNRRQSLDSRAFGFVPMNDILAIVARKMTRQ